MVNTLDCNWSFFLDVGHGPHIEVLDKTVISNKFLLVYIALLFNQNYSRRALSSLKSISQITFSEGVQSREMFREKRIYG